MKTKLICVRLGGLGALLICLPVMWRIHEGDTFNSLSYFLWTLLSLIVTLVYIRDKKGGVTMMAAYVLSDLSIGTYAYYKTGKAVFGRFEVGILILTILCLGLYVVCEVRKRFTPSVILNATAAVIAGIPQFLTGIKDPSSIALWICVLYTLISALSYYGEKPTLNGRLIPAVSIIYWLILIGRIISWKVFT